MFKVKVNAKYQVVSFEEKLEKIIEEAEHELADAEKALKTAKMEFEKLVAIEDTPLEHLEQMEKGIEDLEKERDDAEKQYDKAMHTTIEDMKADQRYETWKGKR